MWNYKFPYVSHFIWPSAVIFDIKGEIYPKVAGYLETRGRLITIDLKAWVINTTPCRGIPATGSCTSWPNTSSMIPMIKRRSLANAAPKW